MGKILGLNDFNLDNVAENTLARLGNLRRDTIKKGIKEPDFMKGSRTLMSSILTEANRPIATLMISTVRYRCRFCTEVYKICFT